MVEHQYRHKPVLYQNQEVYISAVSMPWQEDMVRIHDCADGILANQDKVFATIDKWVAFSEIKSTGENNG